MYAAPGIRVSIWGSLIPMRRFVDYRNYRLFQLYDELGQDMDLAKAHPEIIDLNEGVINSYHFLP